MDSVDMAFGTDAPIKEDGQDLIGRASFAGKLADMLRSVAGPDSLVVGLYGPWGSGKTSVINLVENELSRKEDGDKAHVSVVRFEPWSYLTSEQLLVQFLNDVGKALDGGKLRAKRSEALAAFVDYSESLLTSASSAASLLGGPPIGAAGSAIGKPLAKKLKKAADKAGSVSAKKQALEKELLKFDGRVVVIIDDIDRLPNDQVRMIFQLVASLAKLPKINYLLSFDEEVVTRALSEVQKCDGAEYLEKVVQVPVRLPSISPDDLERILLKDINSVFEMFSYRQDDLDDTRWAGVCSTFLRSRFSTIRELRRFTNALMAKLTVLPRFCCFEDVVAMTAMELKAPKLADWVRMHKDYLCGSISAALQMGQKSPQEARAELQEQLGDAAPGVDLEWALEAVCRLFPRVANKTGMSHCSSYSRESLNVIWRADSFDLYFHTNMPDGVDIHEVQDALNVSDGETLLEDLRGHAGAGDMISFLSAIRARASTLEEGRAEVVAKACLLVLGLSKEKKNAPLASTSADLELIRLTESLFKRIGPTGSKEILHKAIGESGGGILYPLALFSLWELNSLNDAESGGRKAVLPEDAIIGLADAICDKVCEDLARRNLFLDDECHFPLALLERRRPDVFGDYASRVAAADGVGCASFLLYSVARYTTLDGDAATSLSFDESDVAKVVDLSRVADLLAEARADGSFFSLPEDCQLAAAAFCVESEDSDRSGISDEDASELLGRWKRECGRS